jgi:hypothetical protein
MKLLVDLKIISIAAGLFGLIFPQIAFAYLDPGTGSYILQMLIAGLLGILFAIKVFWTRIRIFLSNLFSKKS